MLNICRVMFGFKNGTVKTLNLSCDCDVLLALNESEFIYAGDNIVKFNGAPLEIQLNTSTGQPVVCSNFSQNGTIFKYHKSLHLSCRI